MSIFILDKTDRLKKLTTIWGTDYVATPNAWLSLILMTVAGILIALIFAPVEGSGAQFIVGIVYGIIITLSGFAHGLGHIISSRLVTLPAPKGGGF